LLCVGYYCSAMPQATKPLCMHKPTHTHFWPRKQNWNLWKRHFWRGPDCFGICLKRRLKIASHVSQCHNRQSFLINSKILFWSFCICRIFLIVYSIVKYYLISMKKVLPQKCKILKNDCLLCNSKTLCVSWNMTSSYPSQYENRLILGQNNVTNAFLLNIFIKIGKELLISQTFY